MEKISYEQYLAMLQNIDFTDDDIMEYSIIEAGAGLEVQIRPNPDLVLMTDEQVERENAMKIGNSFSRWRRRSQFNRSIKNGVDLPVLVSEGDSWFQFPFLVNDIIDHLNDDYLIWSVGAAGDTARNMVFGPTGTGRTEYMLALERQKNRVKGFLFSAAGNDIIGEDPDTGERALHKLLKDYSGNENDIADHINLDLFASKILFLKSAYKEVIQNVRSVHSNLPIFIHGYDYVFPYPENAGDPRDPIHTSKKKWLAPALDAHNFPPTELRRNVIKYMLDELYKMLADLAGDSDLTKVYLVDCRGAMPDVDDWIDEIHGTTDGFKKVTARFKSRLADAGL